MSDHIVAHWEAMKAGVRAAIACGLGVFTLGMIACGDNALFGEVGSAGATTSGSGGDANVGGGGGVGGDGVTVSVTNGTGGMGVGGSSTTGGAPGVGGGEGGEDPWVQPGCNPACDFFQTCCDKGDGSPPTCVNDATGCKCDILNPGASCGGFADDCCPDPGSNIGTCTNSPMGCACNPAQPQCGITNTCCDKGNGGFECSNNAFECLCGGDPNVCDFFWDTCCDKGDGERCYQNEDGCM